MSRNRQICPNCKARGTRRVVHTKLYVKSKGMLRKRDCRCVECGIHYCTYELDERLYRDLTFRARFGGSIVSKIIRALRDFYGRDRLREILRRRGILNKDEIDEQ